MAPRFLRKVDQANVNAAGVAEITLTPSSEDWLIRVTRISCTGTTPQPTFTSYRSGVSPANQIEGSYSGFSDASDTPVLIQSGESYIGQWTGAPAGARATLAIEGTAYPPGQGITAYGGN